MQVIFLDFDGADTYYNGEVITINNVTIENSGFTEKEQQSIVATLNNRYSGEIVFVTEQPAGDQFSTIFVGKTNVFDDCGMFDGLAETIDKNNQIKNDNAFVFADSTWNYNKTISVISHETDHIVYGKEHIFLSDNLFDYATTYDYNITSDYSRSSVFAQNAHTQRGGDKFDIPDSLYDKTVINSQYYSFDFVGIGDFNGDGRDDVMIKKHNATECRRETDNGKRRCFCISNRE